MTIIAGGMSDTFQNMAINHIFRSASTAGSNCYLALYVTNPGETDIGEEVSSGNYSRQGITGSFIVSEGSAVNHTYIYFSTASSMWTTSASDLIYYYGIRNGSGGGHNGSLLYYGQLSDWYMEPDPREIEQDSRLFIKPGSLRLSMKDYFTTYLSGKMLNHYLNNIRYPTPSGSLWGGLYYLPSQFSGSIEVSGSIAGYQRILMGGSGSWTQPITGSTNNITNIVFINDAPVEWGHIHGITIFNSASTTASTGSPLFSVELYPLDYANQGKQIDEGDGFRFTPGYFKIKLS